MKTQQIIRGGLLGAVAAILLVFAFLPAPAESAAPLSFDDAELVVIPAAAFVSDGFMPDSFFFPFSAGYFTGDSANYGCMEAPVYVPAGKNVLRMFASVYDNDPARSISIVLRRVDNFAGGTDTMASVNSGSPSNAYSGIQVLSDVQVLDQNVLFPDYSYYVTTCLGSSSIRLYSVRLYFTAEQFLPVMNR